MLFSYIAPIGANNFACCFFYKHNAPSELKIPDFIRVYEKTYPYQPFQWEIADPLFIGVYRLVSKISFQGETGTN
jgi:hypothetical protein